MQQQPRLPHIKHIQPNDSKGTDAHAHTGYGRGLGPEEGKIFQEDVFLSFKSNLCEKRQHLENKVDIKKTKFH